MLPKPRPNSCRAKKFYPKEPNHSTLWGFQGIINQVLVDSSIGACELTPIMQFLHMSYPGSKRGEPKLPYMYS
jgi:hypothetical protein